MSETTPPVPDPPAGTIRRYVIVTPGQQTPRYLDLLHGNFAALPAADRTRFLDALRRDARQISDEELTSLLGRQALPNWRARLTAAWLIGLDRRTGFRDALGHLLLGSEVCFSGQGYCFALAAFGGQPDADLLIAYLDRYLSRPDLRYDQGWALGALLYLDTALGTHHADRYVAPDGLWWRWTADFPGLEHTHIEYRQLIANVLDDWTSPSGNR
ncbi:MAG TPA: DUF6000 family protein [Micromonosporaceae bacterium]